MTIAQHLLAIAEELESRYPLPLFDDPRRVAIRALATMLTESPRSTGLGATVAAFRRAADIAEEQKP